MIGYTEGDEPSENGKYLCWVNPDFDIPYTKHMLLMWMDGKWYYVGSDCEYRDVVYAYAGTIPSLKLITTTERNQ